MRKPIDADDHGVCKVCWRQITLFHERHNVLFLFHFLGPESMEELAGEAGSGPLVNIGQLLGKFR